MSAPLVRAWGFLRNPPLEFVDEDGTVAETWKVGRWERWHIVRSQRWLYAFTRRHDCGCRSRLGWKTLLCWDHADLGGAS